MAVKFVQDYSPGPDAVVELINARIVDVINGCFFDKKTRILIQNGKILSLPGRKGGAVSVPVDFSIDLQGKTVLPGLFNVHCHIQMVNPTLFSDFKTIKVKKKYQDLQVEKNMEDCLACGITHIRDAYTDDLRPNRFLQDGIGNKKIPGPRIQQAVVVGPLGGYLTPELSGMKKFFLGRLGLGTLEYKSVHSGVISFPFDAGRQQVRDAVDRAIDERGADLIKVGESLEESLLNTRPVTMNMEQMEAITDQARRRGVQSTIHCVSTATFRRALTAGFSSLAHMARDGFLTSQDIAACLDTGTLIEPTLSVGYDLSWRLKGDPFYADANLEKLYAFRDETIAEIAETFWLPELRPSVLAGFKKAGQGRYKMLGFLNLSKLLTHFSKMARYGVENTKMLVENGVGMACGNDGGIQSCTPAMAAHELSLFDLFMNDGDTQKKFNGAAAVQTATINSAKSLGIDDKSGSIQAGKTADLVIVDGNPFEDFSILGKQVDALFMEGRLIIDNCGLTV